MDRTGKGFSRLVVGAVVCLLVSGCATAASHRGIVAWNYTSQLPPSTSSTPLINKSIRIQKFEHVPTGGRVRPWVNFLAAVPILSAHLPYSVEVTVNHLLKDGELEQLLLSELQSQSVAAEIRYGGEGADYDLRGKMRLESSTGPASPFGFLSLSPIAWLMGDNFMRARNACEAAFEIISAATGQRVFAKTYVKEVLWKYGAVGNLTSGADQDQVSLGAGVVPVIFKDFVTDLRALPASTWSSEGE